MSKFDPKSPKESVPNGQSKFLMRYAIRWFKFTLKPPKNPTWSFKSTLNVSLNFGPMLGSTDTMNLSACAGTSLLIRSRAARSWVVGDAEGTMWSNAGKSAIEYSWHLWYFHTGCLRDWHRDKGEWVVCFYVEPFTLHLNRDRGSHCTGLGRMRTDHALTTFPFC